MAVAFRASSALTSATTNPTFTRPAAVADGDLIIVISVWRAGAATFGLPSGWTNIVPSFTVGAGMTGVVQGHIAAAGETSYVMQSPGTGTLNVWSFTAYTGHDGTMPTVSATDGAATAATTINAPSIAGVNNGLLVSAWMGQKGTTYTTSVETERADVLTGSNTGISQMTADLALVADGATGTKVATPATSVNWMTVSLLISPASAAGPTPRRTLLGVGA